MEKTLLIFREQIRHKSDKLMNYFLISFYIVGYILAPFYDTWFIAAGVGTLSLLAYYSARWLMPSTDLYQYIASTALAIFMAQFIYQMHGLFEMHFIAFISSTMLITYQKWKLQIPLIIVVVLHHAIFGYLQFTGNSQIYFTQLEYMDLQTFVIHVILAGTIFFICGLWAYNLDKNTINNVRQSFDLARFQQEVAQKEELLKANLELASSKKITEAANEQLEKEIAQREKHVSELIRLNAKLESFAYIVSHDLKSPLRAIANLSQWIEDDFEGEISPAVKEHLDLLRKRVLRMESLINGILMYSKIEQLQERIEDIDLNELVNEIQLSMNIPETFNLHLATPLPFIKTDKVKMQQVFSNLISNAFKHHHGLHGNITISYEEKGEMLEFKISDDGPGIEEQYFEKIFVIFQTLTSRDNKECTGIGLTIVKKLVEEAGGKIYIDSSIGIGSSFIFTWPKDLGKERNTAKLITA